MLWPHLERKLVPMEPILHHQLGEPPCLPQHKGLHRPTLLLLGRLLQLELLLRPRIRLRRHSALLRRLAVRAQGRDAIYAHRRKQI